MARSCYIVIIKKILKEPGTSFQSPAFNQKYARNVCHTAQIVFDQISF